MKLNTRNFGEITFEEKDKIHFVDGLPGFEEEKEYVMLNNHDTKDPVPFMWLQSTKDKELAFVISIPFFLKKDYEVDIPDDVCKKLDIKEPSEAVVYSICKIKEKVEDMTVDFMSPLIINIKTKQGYQVVQYDSNYSSNEKIK